MIALGDDGRWETESHPGDSYVAMLVKASYVPADTVVVRPKVIGDVVAIDEESEPVPLKQPR